MNCILETVMSLAIPRQFQKFRNAQLLKQAVFEVNQHQYYFICIARFAKLQCHLNIKDILRFIAMKKLFCKANSGKKNTRYIQLQK